MYCTNCGKEILDEAVVCVHCGNTIRPLNLISQTQPTAQRATAADNRNKLALAGVILSCLGVLGWVFSLVGLILSIMGLVQSKTLKTGKGLGIAGIVLSVVMFFVHCFLMWLLMPIIAGIGMFIILLLVMI